MSNLIEDIVRWIVENVDASVVPADAGNGLQFSASCERRPYYYEEEQNREIAQRFGVV